jgi:hypothetical protein
MLTKEQIIAAVKGGRESEAFPDSRDYARLTEFFDSSEWPTFGFSIKEGATPTPPKEFTEAAVREQLARDVAFGFEKALDQRGISAGAMYCVVRMWMWILEDELQNHDNYAQYGLPLLKAIAVKYDLPNPIGDDVGNEHKYASN